MVSEIGMTRMYQRLYGYVAVVRVIVLGFPYEGKLKSSGISGGWEDNTSVSIWRGGFNYVLILVDQNLSTI